MTIFNKKEHTKRIPIRLKVIHAIGVSGHLSRSRAAKIIKTYYPNIHDTFKELKENKIIEHSYWSKIRRPEEYFKLTGEGFFEFIDQSPSPWNFSTAMIWFCGLKKGSLKKDEFEKYWDLYVQKYIGTSSLSGCFIHPDFFENIFAKWYRDTTKSNANWTYKYRIPHKVLQCLAVNPAITIEQICKETQLSKEDVRNTLDDYSITQDDLHKYARTYQEQIHMDQATRTTYEYIQHLIVVTKREKESIKYELSFIGVLLVLSIIAYLCTVTYDDHPLYINLPKPLYRDLPEYYRTVTSNYKGKLPIIFGYGNSLRNKIEYPDITTSTLYDIFFQRSQIFSIPILLGGNKEIYDNIHWARSATFIRLEEIYRSFTSSSRLNYPDKFVNKTDLKLIEIKLKEIRILLKYSSIQSFAKYMTKNQSLYKRRSIKIRLTVEEIERLIKAGEMPSVSPSLISDEELFSESYQTNYEEELSAIENIFAEEFTSLFYIGLLRYNNYVASDYPFATGTAIPNDNSIYPVDLLKEIIHKDEKLKERIETWFMEAREYQKKTLDRMNQISQEMNMSI